MLSRNNLWIVGAIASLVYGLLSYLVPFQLDDIWYAGLRDRFGGYMEIMQFHWLEQNGRLGNLLCPFLIGELPKWLFAIAVGCCSGGLLVQSARLSCRAGDRCDWCRILFFWLVFAVGLPWHDDIMVADFALNYVLSAWLNITFLTVFFGHRRVGLLFMICGVAAGWSHEGVSVPLLCGLLLWGIVRSKEFDRRKCLLLICYALGIAIVVSSPGLWERAANKSELAAELNLRTMMRTAVFWFPAASALLLTFCLCGIVKRWRQFVVKAFADSVSFVGIAAIVCSYFIVLYTGASFRGAFMAELLSVVVVFRTFIGRVNKPVAIVSAVLLTVFYGGVLWWQYKLDRQNRTIEQKLSRNGGPLFIPLIDYTPCYTLGHPSDGQWRNPLQYVLLNEKYGVDEPIVVLPQELADFGGKTYGVELEGDAGAVLYGDFVLIPESEEVKRLVEMQSFGDSYLYGGFNVRNRKGREYSIYASLRGFKAADGRVWYLLTPDRRYWRDNYEMVDFSL